MIYNGEKIILNDLAEEYITYYAHPRYDSYRNENFNKNFWNDFKILIDKKLDIQKFELCDISLIKQYVLETKEKKEKHTKK